MGTMPLPKPPGPLGDDSSGGWKYSRVQVVTVYQVACQICGEGCVDGETHDEFLDAENARDFHEYEVHGKPRPDAD